MSFRVLSAQIMHESNSFSVRLTSLDRFADVILLHGDEALRALDGTNTEVAGLPGCCTREELGTGSCHQCSR